MEGCQGIPLHEKYQIIEHSMTPFLLLVIFYIFISSYISFHFKIMYINIGM